MTWNSSMINTRINSTISGHPSSKEPATRVDDRMGAAICSATGNTSSTQSDSSAMDDRPKPVPTPRKVRNQPTMGNLVLVDRSNANAAASAAANAAQPKVLTVILAPFRTTGPPLRNFRWNATRSIPTKSRTTMASTKKRMSTLTRSSTTTRR